MDWLVAKTNFIFSCLWTTLFIVAITDKSAGSVSLNFDDFQHLKEHSCLLKSGWWRQNDIRNASHHCRWPGVGCNNADKVDTISLRDTELLGVERNLAELSLSCFPNLGGLVLHGAGLVGSIPPEIGTLTELSYLDLSSNQLTGHLPHSLGKLKNLFSLNISSNILTGEIPRSLGQLVRLSSLSLSLNQISGPIPGEIGDITNLHWLDLSSNNISGTIPFQLSRLTDLYYLDLSYNSLHGSLSDVSLRNIPLYALMGNKDLEICGDPDGYLPRCSRIKARSRFNAIVVVIIPISIFLAVLLSVFVLYSVHIKRRRIRHNKNEEREKFAVWDYDGQIAYEDIRSSTEDFDSKYCIGTGGHGTVYKAQLPNGDTVALKKLKCSSEAQDPALRTSFENEVKTLSEIRHRNIVKLHGYCLYRGSMLLVYEYMEKGSLSSI